MNTILTTPDVKLFVAAVREHLSDLTEEEREELVGGLEGDMSDLVSERGVDSLPEPSEYARELRTAAGFAPEGRSAGSWLERAGHARARADRLLASGAAAATWAFVRSLQPVWWVFRAWLAAQLIDVSYGADLPTPVPTLMGVGPGVAVTAVFVVVSVQVGRGRWWPGGGAHLSSRVVLVGLNLFAVVLTPLILGQFPGSGAFATDADQSYVAPEDGLSFRGQPIANIYPYDAAGHPLTGVQLVDRQGRRLSITQDPYHEGTGWGEFVVLPWMNGRTKLYSAFPLAERTVDTDTGQPVGDSRIQSPPYASLPPVTLAGVTASVLQPTR